MSRSKRKHDPSSTWTEPPPPGVRNIILAGFMGSGKSTVGRILARRLEWEFTDTDWMIETAAGKSITEIFTGEGEEVFRDLETQAAARLEAMAHHVIATGGGFMLRRENREAAARAGTIILLMASPEQIWHRVGRSRSRPLLRAGDDPMVRIRQLLKEREAAYQAIATRVDTDGLTPEAVAEAVMNKLMET